jgi:hypothetical protein
MPKENRVAPATPRHPREELIACHSPGGLDGVFRPASELRHIYPAQFAFGVEPRGQPLDELRVRFARSPAQLMIKMADNEAPVSEI